MANINWYPGHMTKAKRMMAECLPLIDVAIELVDARIPFSSKNPDIAKMTENKPKFIVLNKSDLPTPSRIKNGSNIIKARAIPLFCLTAKQKTARRRSPT